MKQDAEFVVLNNHGDPADLRRIDTEGLWKVGDRCLALWTKGEIECFYDVSTSRGMTVYAYILCDGEPYGRHISCPVERLRRPGDVS